MYDRLTSVETCNTSGQAFVWVVVSNTLIPGNGECLCPSGEELGSGVDVISPRP